MGILCLYGHAQTMHDWEQAFTEWTTIDDADTDGWEDAYEVLSELELQPINLNTATREDLERIPFLTAQQIEELYEYIDKYGGMKSLGELAMIESLDPHRRRLLQYFVCLKEPQKGFPSLKTIAKYGRHELMATGKIPFYKRHGDDDGYLGYPYKHSLRYTFQYGEYVKAGLMGAQDAGEPFFSGGNNLGYDHYAFYVLLRKLGCLKTLAVGQYKIHTGMGLVMNNDFYLGKIATLTSLGRSSNVIRPNTSRMEASFLQGAAATVTLMKGLDLSAFFSWRKIDATLTSDGNGIATLLTSGYHRTESEMRRKHNASQTIGGGNIRYSYKAFKIGLTGVYTSYSKPLIPTLTQKYKEIYPQGNHFWNASIDYSYTHHRFAVSGETAIGDGGGIATINSLSYLPVSNLTLLVLQRYYSYKYHAPSAQSFCSGGKVQNESGVYVGADWRINRHWQLSAYSDYAYFPWPKYQIGDASHAWDNFLQVKYTSKHTAVLARYRLVMRQKDNAKKTALADDITHRGRLVFTYDDQRCWQLKTQADITLNDYKERSFGYMLSQNAEWRHKWLKVMGTVGYFHTKDYNSRVYLYERGPLYTYSFPSFYGKGIRLAIVGQAHISRNLMVLMKMATTDYFDRDHISSGLQQIDRSSMTDLELQVQWKF